jgi:hypothetical protein
MDLPKPCEHDSADNPLRPWCPELTCSASPPSILVQALGHLWEREWRPPGGGAAGIHRWRKVPTLPVPGVGRAAGAFAAAADEQVRQMQEAAHERGLQAIGYAQTQQPETMLVALASMPAELVRYATQLPPGFREGWMQACANLQRAADTLTDFAKRRGG